MRKPLLVLLPALVAAFVLVLDPIGWWTFNFNFDDVEMRAAVEGNWSLTVIDPEGKSSSWKLAIKQGTEDTQRSDRGWIRAATACGNRSLVRNASACVDITAMPLDIAVLDHPKSPRATGTFEVMGTSFGSGQLHLAIEGASVHAKISPAGEVLDVDMHDQSTVKLVRTSGPAAHAR